MRRFFLVFFPSIIIILSYSSVSANGSRAGGRSEDGLHMAAAGRNALPPPPQPPPTPPLPPLPSPSSSLGGETSSSTQPPSDRSPATSTQYSLTTPKNVDLHLMGHSTPAVTSLPPTLESHFDPQPTRTNTEVQFNEIPSPSDVNKPVNKKATQSSSVYENTRTNTTPVYRLGAVFEPGHIQSLSAVFFQSLQEQNHASGNAYRLEGVAIETPALNISALRGACETLRSEGVSVGVAVGGTPSIYASGTLASLARVPLLARSLRGYRDDTLKTLLPELLVANPRLMDLWNAATSFISALKWKQPVLIHDDSPQALQLAHIASRDVVHQPMGISLSATLPRHHFQNRLSAILHTVRRMIFVSGTVKFVNVLFSQGQDLDMFNGEYVWILLDIPLPGNVSEFLRPGLISLRPDFLRTSKKQLFIDFVKSSISVISEFFQEATTTLTSPPLVSSSSPLQCEVPYGNLSKHQFELHRQLEDKLDSTRRTSRSLPGLIPLFYVENLIPKKIGEGAHWTRIGYVNGSAVQVNAIFWPGRGYRGVVKERKRLRVALAEAPPFVMTSDLIENTTCLLGVVCLKVYSAEVAATFADMERQVVNASRGYQVLCCNGLSVDLMLNLANDLNIQLQVYLVKDGTFGAPRSNGWTGVVGDLLDGSAHLSFAPLSVTAQRARHLEFSDPYFYSSMSILSSTKQMEVPLLAFLVPFSPELWIAIFVSLNITAFSVAVYEWLSPFGLNPWGRQRSKNFSYGSALWVIWGLLFSHLVAFKAPKSWPNKVLINVWGAFSVIFVASYTANIAALFAGLFQTRYLHDRSLLSLRVGAVRSSSSEYYMSTLYPDLWAHMRPSLVDNFTHGLHKLHSGTLDLLVGDSAVSDYLRGHDPGCTLGTHGDDLVSDTLAIAMAKGFPLRVKINAVLARYQGSGHLDHLKHKWYGELPCFRLSADIYKPQALEIRTVAGVFLMLTLGIGVGLVILILEHLVYRYILPSLRTKPRESVWRNRNLMFFSQKLYKFINCVELVSPHHSAKELFNNLRTGQIMGLFQKSVKRKENEQRRRRKSKAQFFEMIQEIRRVQKAEKEVVRDVICPTETRGTKKVTPTPSKGHTPARSTTSRPTPAPCPASAPRTPVPVSYPVSSTRPTTAKPPESITIDYLPGPDPCEDSEGVIVVNSALPLRSSEREEAMSYRQKDTVKDEDSGSGIIILKVSEPEEAREVNSLNQQIEEFQAYRLASENVEGFKKCTCPHQDDIESSRRKVSGGCLNCLQRQDSTRQDRRPNDVRCHPCSGASNVREREGGGPEGTRKVSGGTANGLRHRGSATNPSGIQAFSPTLPPNTKSALSSPDPVTAPETSNEAMWSTRSLEDVEAVIVGEVSEDDMVESVRLVPLSRQAAIKSSGSLQLVAALSPGTLSGRDRVNANHLRHVTKSDLWRLWQDSETQLRSRLRQAESQRDELLRKLSTTSLQRRHSSLPETQTTSASQITSDAPNSNRSMELLRDQENKTSAAVRAKHGDPLESPYTSTEPQRLKTSRKPLTRMKEIDSDDDLFVGSLTRMNMKEKPVRDERQQCVKAEVSASKPRRKLKLKAHERNEVRKSIESLEKARIYTSSDDRPAPQRSSSSTSRKKRDKSLDSTRGSEDVASTPKRDSKRHHGMAKGSERDSPSHVKGGYSTTPLPLLHNLHQHTMNDVERVQAHVHPLPLDRREERLSHDPRQSHVILPPGEGIPRVRHPEVRVVEDPYEVDERRKPYAEEDRNTTRRRRSSYQTEGQVRRPRERLQQRDGSEGRHRRDFSKPKNSKVSTGRKLPERGGELQYASSSLSLNYRQLAERRRISYGSSSEQEEGRQTSSTPSDMNPDHETHGRRRHHSFQRLSRSYDDIIDDRRSGRDIFKEPKEPP